MLSAFLIVNGLSTFQLTHPVINIGCDPANHLVLNGPNISPVHAQLRCISGHFVIFDLESKHGTFVNGAAVSNRVLHPGDVILLAGVPLVYGQETSLELGYTREIPADPPSLEVLEG
jgi:pSer/pThr/pTyr-binding forkhead associated (FHA) protein